MVSTHSTWKTWNYFILRDSEPVNLRPNPFMQVSIKGLGLSTLPTTVVRYPDIYKAESFWSLDNTCHNSLLTASLERVRT